MIRINSRFVRQAIVAFAFTACVSSVSFAQSTSGASTTASTTQSTGTSQSLANILALTCSACTGGSRIQAQ